MRITLNREGNQDLRSAEKAFHGRWQGPTSTDFRLHDTRHTFASRLAMEGVDLLAKELGGWKSLGMAQRNAHLSPSHRSQAIEHLVTREASGPEGQGHGHGVAP